MPAPKTRIRRHRDLILSTVVVGLSAATVLTCSALGGSRAPSTTQEVSATHKDPTSDTATVVPTPSLAIPSAPASAEELVSEIGQWIHPEDLGRSAEGNAIPKLEKFYGALARLENRLRHDHVRILWLGDSHTQADVWTHAVRAKLQEVFGVGGPGFVHVGWNTHGYRREQVTLRTSGIWGLQPATLVSPNQVGDGVFGLGGLRIEPRGADAVAEVVVDAKGLPGKGSWDLAVRFIHPDSSIVVKVDGREQRIEAQGATLGQIRHVPLESKGPGGTLRVERGWNKPQLLGVVVEAAEAHGVVVDTLGLNSARYRSALAWDETTWVAELARRSPDLVVLAFGTNESSDANIRSEGHGARVKALVDRVRKAAPEADCLLFGPIDRGGERYEKAVQQLNEAQEAAAKELGCAFWNGQQAMGGPGSMRRWASMNPPLGGADKIHLYPRGYQKLGEMMVRDLLQGYRAGGPEPNSE